MDRLKTFTCRICFPFFEWLMTETWLEFDVIWVYLFLTCFVAQQNEKELSQSGIVYRGSKEIWHDNNQ